MLRCSSTDQHIVLEHCTFPPFDLQMSQLMLLADNKDPLLKTRSVRLTLRLVYHTSYFFIALVWALSHIQHSTCCQIMP
jgi:hypothetical protein